MSLVLVFELKPECLIRRSTGISCTGSRHFPLPLQSVTVEILCSPKRTATLEILFHEFLGKDNKSYKISQITNDAMSSCQHKPFGNQ